MSSHCMGVASRWNYNGDCMIKILQGAGVVTPSKPPSEQLSSLPAFTSFTATPPPPIQHPFSPHNCINSCTGMQATHKTWSTTCNVLLSSILLSSNRITLQTPVYRVLTTLSGQSKCDILIRYILK